MKLRSVAISVAATTALALSAAAPALAQDVININPGNVPTTAEDFDTHECKGPFADLPEGLDGWHFIAPGQSSFIDLTASFDTGDITIDHTHDETNAEGYFTDAGPNENMHAWVFAPAGSTLEGATATVDDKGQQDFFVLSHTCPGEPEEENGNGEEENGNGEEENGNGEEENGNGEEEDANGEEPKKTVPTAVPAGHGDTGSGVAGTVGLIAALTAAAAAGAMLIRRRFGHES